MQQLFATLYGLLSFVVVAFQVALVFGAPWGEYTLGGRWRGPLPPRVRLIPLASIILLLAFATIIARHANIAVEHLPPFAPMAVWVVVVFCGLSCLANATSKSRKERALWLPVVLMMCASSLLVAVT